MYRIFSAYIAVIEYCILKIFSTKSMSMKCNDKITLNKALNSSKKILQSRMQNI